MLNLSIESFVNPFVDIALTFLDSSFNSFLFDVTSFSLLSKSVLFTKLLTLGIYFALDSSKRSNSSQLSNTGYFSFNLIYFSIKRSNSS